MTEQSEQTEQDRQAKVAVIHYSSTGIVHRLATLVADAAREAGADVRLLKVGELAPAEAIAANPGWAAHAAEVADLPEATHDDLTWADAVIFGTPVRYGQAAAQLKQFIDGTGALWGQGLLADKVYSAFTSSATAHGGQESTLLGLNNVFIHWGGIIVTPGYTDPAKFADGNPYGTSHTSNNAEIAPDDTAATAAAIQARRVVTVTSQLLAGRAALAG